METVTFRTQNKSLFVFTSCIYHFIIHPHDLISDFISDMASLFRLGARAVSRQYISSQTPARIVIQARSMGSDPYSGMPPTTTLGGQFKNPV